jgi:CheY-like chemotaxis protein
MKRSQVHVLIVDDDATQGKALLEAFNRQGYTAVWCNSSAQALTTAQRQEFQCLFIDCVLPKMNGVDLAEEIINLALNRPKIFLYSGIFKERSFIKEATERTKCQAFLTKPLDLENILGSMDGLFGAHENDEDDPPLMRLYSKTNLTDEDILNVIANETTIHSLHLPMLLKLMQKSRLSGDLSLITGVGELSTVSFYDGRIFAVRTPDKETFFGAIAVEFGFVASDDILAALESPSNKRIGQKLIESFSLSPHAINVILEEQLALRLSQCVQNNVVSLQWTNRKYEQPDCALNLTRFDNLLEDWLRSKFDLETLNAVLGLWSNFQLEGKFHPSVQEPMPLEQLATQDGFDEKRDLPYLYRQLLRREAFFGAKGDEEPQDFSFLESRLDLLLKEHKDQNYFQILGVAETAKSLEINKAFADLKSYFDPAKLPSGCPPGVLVKCTKVFQQIESAYKTLSEDGGRDKYVMMIENQRAQKRFEAEPILRAAITELQHGHAEEAAEKFQTLINRKLEIRDLRSYRIWAGLKIDRTYRDITLDQVPPEERHTAPYMMACGIYFRSKGKVQKAVEAFRNAHILDPRLNVARSELKSLLSELERRGARTAIREVSTVVESLFGKTRRGA